MLIIAGHLEVIATERDAYVIACQDIVRRAREVQGCHGFVIAADSLEPTKVHMFEAWQDDGALARWRSESNPPAEVAPILSADVHRYDVAQVRDPFDS